MSQTRTTREKVILTLTGAVVLAFVFVEYIGEPLYLKQKNQQQKIENKILFIDKYHEILNQKDYYQEKEQVNKKLTVHLAKIFLSPSQPALAAAGLQKSLEDKAKKSRVHLVQVKVEKAKFMEDLLTVPIKITVKSSLEGLTRLIWSIENDEKLLVVEELVVQRRNKKEPEQLESHLLVNGFIQQRKPEKTKTT